MSYDQLADAVDKLAASTSTLTAQALATQIASDAAKDVAITQSGIAAEAAITSTTSRQAAAASAAEANSSKNSATASASTATLKAGEAVTSAAAALASQNAAKTSETNAKASEVAALPAVAAGLRFCGVSATAPTTRTNGTALQSADEYQNSVDNLRYSWSGTAWVALNSSAQQLESLLASSDGAKKVGGATVNLYSLLELQMHPGRRAGDTASINSVVDGWAVNTAYPFPSGGGDFVWDAQSTAEPIVGMLVQVSGVTAGRWKRKYSGSVHVTWTGAIPDGLTKCSAAFQIAVDNYQSTYIPPGKFLLESFSTHTMIYNFPTVVTCGIKLLSAHKGKELYGAGEATTLIGQAGVRYNALISQYNVTDVSVHSFKMEGLYDRSGSAFLGPLIGIRQQSIRRCTTHSLKISNFAYHCLAMYGGSDAVTEPACVWNKAYDLYLDDGGQSSFLLYSSTFTGLVLPNEYNQFSDIYAMNSHVYFGVEVRKSNNNTFTNLVTNSNMKGGLNLEEGASRNKFVNWESRFNLYGLHITGNGVENVTGNRITNFTCSGNRGHNVLAFQGAVGNYFTGGSFSNSAGGNGWRSEDSSSYGNYFDDIDCENNIGEGLLFQNYEHLNRVRIQGNTLRGVTVFGPATLRRVISRGNGTNITTLAGVMHDIADCDFGPRHAITTKDSVKIGQFIGVGQASVYAGSGPSAVEVTEAGSISSLVWKNGSKDGKFITIPSGFYAGAGFTSLKVALRVKTDGPARLLRDINGAANIPIPINTGWVWVTHTVSLASVTSATVINIRYEGDSDVGFVLLDGYQLSLV